MRSYRRLQVRLSKGDREKLNDILSGGVQAVRTVLRALALCGLDEGRSASQVAAEVRLTSKAVREIGRRYEDGGMEPALAQEKTLGELKGEFALDAVPTNHYGANSAWLQLCILAHNLMRSFQLHLRLATPKPSSWKRTSSYRIASMKTLRFLVINRAARLARISGRKVLRFSSNPATESLYERILYRLAA